MKIINFNDFINEQADDNNSVYDDLKTELRQFIERSLKTSDKKTVEDFIDAFKRDSEKNQIEGLINDADIYEFYLKYRNNIDEKLSEIKFYEEKPSDMDCFSLYDFLVKGTKKAIAVFVEEISVSR